MPDATSRSALRAVARALTRALPLLFSGRLLARILLPLLVLWLAWLAVGIALWTPLSDAIAHVLGGAAPGTFTTVSAHVVTMLVWASLVLLTSLLVVALVAMPAIVRVVGVRHYRDLQRRNGGSLAGSLWNATLAVLRYVAIWLVTLPLLPLAPLYVLISLANTAALNARLFRYDALAEHADAHELRGVIVQARGRWFLLGLALAPLALIPLVNFVAPLYSGIAFACLALDELARRRRAEASRTVPS
ncbi:MAG TPA: EI24 domain-containing protein [Casimicrobiaceae bacterium]|nr:EI24 domain-containing protein [Casimicrobiaceae bacterium]